MGKLGVIGAALTSLAITVAPNDSQARLNSEAEIESSIDLDEIKVQPGECPPGTIGLQFTCNNQEHGSINGKIDIERLVNRRAIKEGLSES
ncbi:hypothetical protein KKG51_04470 [Patescibacteria group bacterium]|nr:hypothetical protein [Patescibacteria group bacterium]